jgi:hypothetical protein
LKIDHKPLEWLVIVSNAYKKIGWWIDMLQDFNFKILHRSGSKHSNVNALSRNPVSGVEEDEKFSEEI